MERRKQTLSKSGPLPLDYIKMVDEVFNAHFEESLKIFNTLKPNSKFEATGEVLADELIVAISLVTKNVLAATTVYASADFDPKASSPSIQDILSACIDAIATIFDTLLSPDHPEKIDQVAGESLSNLEDVPFEWTETESNQRKVYIRVDKANPKLEALANEWLMKNDPEVKTKLTEEQDETADLFVTGANHKIRSKGFGSGTPH